MDATSLEGTIFEGRVAHGYFVLSKAAGLFVDPMKGPVLLNYGLDECRFVKPVYPGMTIGVKFTVKEKISQEKRDAEDIAKGIVKFFVDVYDETGESVAACDDLDDGEEAGSELREKQFLKCLFFVVKPFKGDKFMQGCYQPLCCYFFRKSSAKIETGQPRPTLLSIRPRPFQPRRTSLNKRKSTMKKEPFGTNNSIFYVPHIIQKKAHSHTPLSGR